MNAAAQNQSRRNVVELILNARKKNTKYEKGPRWLRDTFTNSQMAKALGRVFLIVFFACLLLSLVACIWMSINWWLVVVLGFVMAAFSCLALDDLWHHHMIQTLLEHVGPLPR